MSRRWPPGAAWVVLPTYQEAENITSILRGILDVFDVSAIDGHVLVVDDSSPDGTADLADRVGQSDARVSVLRRTRKEGIGPAYRDGFREALAAGAVLVLEMDADFSHDPVAIGDFLTAVENADLVLGSRYLHGVTVVNWPLSRLILSYSANVYTRIITGLPVRDATGGFKCFRRRALEAINLDHVRSDGYAFQIEMSYKCWRKGFKIVEIPITFVDRRAGVSKMNNKIVWEAAWMVWRLRIMDLLGQTAWMLLTP